MPILFLKTGWMARYQGFKGDTIFSTMRYVRKHNSGHELNNFKSLRGKCFGYAPVSGIDIQKHFGQIGVDLPLAKAVLTNGMGAFATAARRT